jgi:hypothetical protein
MLKKGTGRLLDFEHPLEWFVPMKHALENPMYRFLILLSIAAAVGLQAWQTLFNNFAVEVADMQGHHIGIIQSVREVPGFLALLAIYVLLIIKEHRLSALSVLLLGLGLGVTGFFPSFSGLILTTLFSSFGYHYYETTKKSLTLQHFDTQTAPWVFGKQNSVSAASNVVVGLFIYVVTFMLSYSQAYLVIGGFVCAVALWGIYQNPTASATVPQRKKMVFRKKYWLYYFLTFMSGARRQIFMAFAAFLMVKKFEFSIQEIALLFVLNNIIGYFLAPLIGKSIIRFGERKVLSFEYIGLFIIFLAYAVVQTKFIAASLYILDHVFFNFAIGINTYFQKIGDPKDIASTMAVGFTINHIAAVFLPALGGFLWMVDYRIPFVAGAGMALISLLAVQKIRTVAS